MKMIETKNKQLEKENVIGFAEEEDRVYYLVTEKKEKEELNEKEIIAEKVLVSPFKKKETKVIEIGEVKAQAFRKKYRPLVGGCEIQPIGTNWVGTLGALCRTYKIGNKSNYLFGNYKDLLERHGLGHILKEVHYGLTNAHVICKNIGNPSLDEEIRQPATGGKVGFTISAVPLNQDTNYVDAALMELITEMEPKQLGGIGVIKGITRATKGLPIRKFGRTTGYTEGEVRFLNAQVNVTYPSGMKKFSGVIIATRMSDGGDSGSLVVSKGGMAVGLIFAGSSEASMIIPITTILKYFKGVELVNG